MARVCGLFVAGAKAEPMISKEAVDLVAGKGILGDRYAEGRGTYQAFKEPGRQLTLMSADAIEQLLHGKPGTSPSVGDLRRNVALRGISAADLASYIGREVRLGGECRVFVHRLCVPCKYNMRLNKCGAEMEEFLWDATGVNCEVIKGGRLQVGDAVQVVPGSEDPGRVEHGKPPEFFIRPSQRPKRSTSPPGTGKGGQESYSAVMESTVPKEPPTSSSKFKPVATPWGGYEAAVLTLVLALVAVLLWDGGSNSGGGEL